MRKYISVYKKGKAIIATAAHTANNLQEAKELAEFHKNISREIKRHGKDIVVKVSLKKGGQSKMKELDSIEKRRKRLLNWHSQKQRSVSIIDLLESDYQNFRYKVKRRVGHELDFKEAIKLATEAELLSLEQTRDEKRLNI